MIHFIPGSQLWQLITLLSFVGEYPHRSRQLLGNKNAYKILINSLTRPQTICNPQTGMAVASRLEAMKARQKQYYLSRDRDGNNLLYEGVLAEGRITSVIKAGIFVDLFGVEVYISMKELSYQRWIDASEYYRPGQRVIVRILSVDRSDRNNIKVKASVKQAKENPYEKALKRFVEGNQYVGTVSMVDENGVFVAMDGGIDCLCEYPRRGRPPIGSRVTVRVIGINRSTNRMWGAITHTTTAY